MKNPILIGSRAVTIDINRKFGLDYDFLITSEDAEKLRFYYHGKNGAILKNSEYGFAIKFNNSILEYDFRPSTQELIEILNTVNTDINDLVYVLKMSHRYLKNSPHFHKTMRDIKTLRKHGCKVPEHLDNWFRKREKETYSYKHPNLNQKKSGFFKDTYAFDHDSIHRAIAFFDKPAYVNFKDDEKEVWCSRDKFKKSSEEIKLASVYEEAGVLALERCLIPFNFKPSVKFAFSTALMKICTSITSGWYREYCWENHDIVWGEFINNTDYIVDKFNEGVKNGTVIRTS